MSKARNCWSCGAKITAEEIADGDYLPIDGKAYCDDVCYNSRFRTDESEPIDYDASDRAAASSERIANHFAER